VPGAVRSWGDAHRRWGRLSRERVLAEAIEQAGAGFAAWDGLVAAVERTAAGLRDADWAGGFHAIWRPEGRRWRPGERVRLPALASTLETLARDGFDAYYDGQIGEWLVQTLVDAGAPFDIADFRGHASTWGTAIDASYRGVRVATHPPNSSGIVALDILGVLGRFVPPDGAAFAGRGWTDAAWLHLQLEAAKLAYADRDAWLADPDVREVAVDRFLDPGHAADLAARIDPGRALADPEPARTLVGGTIYLAVVDADGNAVSLIQSNAAGFGSGVMCGTTGVHFQNRGASFSLDPSSPNVLEPRKRPAHTLMPAMWFREGEARPWVVAGSMGGDIQPQIHVQLVSAMVDGGADLATAVAAPRVVVSPDGYVAPPVAVHSDGELARDVAEGLIARGHRLSAVPYDGSLGHEHAIELVDGGPAAGGSLIATTDPRSAGLPAVR
jgi:gamma-glutamyltranspeptidase/glutathione hydrolase